MKQAQIGRRAALGTLITALICLAPGGARADDFMAPTSTLVAGTPIGPVTLATVDLENWYDVSLTVGQVLTLAVTQTSAISAYAGVQVFSPDGVVIASATGSVGTEVILSVAAAQSSTDWMPLVPAGATNPGSYRVRVYALQVYVLTAPSLTYTLTAYIRTQNDGTIAPAGAGSVGDAPNAFDEAPMTTLTPTAVMTSYYGQLFSPGDLEDWYKLDVVTPGVISLSLSQSEGAVYNFAVYSSTRDLVASGAGAAALTGWAMFAAAADTYRVRITYGSGPSGMYELRLLKETQNDAATGGDAGNTFDTATALPGATPFNVTGQLYSAGDPEDWYTVTLAAGQTLWVNLNPPVGSNYDLQVWSPAGVILLSSAAGGAVGDNALLASPLAGTYRLRVTYVSGTSGRYALGAIIGNQSDGGVAGDAGNDFNTARAIASSGTYTGQLFATGDVEDWYRLDLTAGMRVLASIVPPAGANYDFTVWSPDGIQLVGSAAGGALADSLVFYAPTDGAYEMRIYYAAGPSGAYTIALQLASQGDAGSGEDAGNTFATAMLVDLNNAYTGTLYSSGDVEDWYKVHLTGDDAVFVGLTPPIGANFDLAIWSPDGYGLLTSGTGGTLFDGLWVAATTTGDYRIRVYYTSGPSGDYALSIFGGPQNDGGAAGDAGNFFSSAKPIAKTGVFSGTLVPTGDPEDWYSVPLVAGDKCVLGLTPPVGANFELQVWSPDGVNYSGSSAGGANSELITFAAALAGDYRIRVFYGASAGGQYTLTLGTTAQADGGTTGDAGNTFAAATLLAAAGSYSGELLIVGDFDDWYGINLADGDAATVRLFTTSSNNYGLEVWSPDGTLITPSTPLSSTVDVLSTAAYVGGEYRIHISLLGGYAQGRYSFSVELAPQNDAATSTDAGNEAGAAAPAPAGSYTGTLYEYGDREDWYAVPVTAGNSVRVSVSSAATRPLVASLWSPTGQSLGRHQSPDLGTLSAPAVKAGTYYVQIALAVPPQADGSATATVAPMNYPAAGISYEFTTKVEPTQDSEFTDANGVVQPASNKGCDCAAGAPHGSIGLGLLALAALARRRRTRTST